MDFKIKDDKIKKQRNTDKLDEKVQLLLEITFIHRCVPGSLNVVGIFHFRKRRKRKKFCNSMSSWIMLCGRIIQGGEKIEYKLISGIISARH